MRNATAAESMNRTAAVAFLMQLCTLVRAEGRAVTMLGAPPVVADALALIGADDVIRDWRRPAA
jgi:anti-anti-sigma regulatory factor